jgi:4-amino-4-deoxy-L-arabinose transferase-like glycosyltransferase
VGKEVKGGGVSTWRLALTPPVLGLALLFLAGVGGGVFIATAVFERVPHVEDEHAFLFQARVFAEGKLYAETPPSADLFPMMFVLDREGRRFGKYPPGFPLVLAAGVLVGQPWLVNPLLAGLGLVAVALLGRVLYGWGTGLVAGGLGLISPFFLLSAGSYMSHNATLLWLTLFALLALAAARRRTKDEGRKQTVDARVSQESRPPERLGTTFVFRLSSFVRRPPEGWLMVGAGACLALALITRPLTAAGGGAPVLAGVALAGWRAPARLGRWALLGLVGAAPVLAFFLLWNTVALGGPLRNGYEMWWDFDRVGFGTGSLGNHSPAQGWSNLQYNLDDLSQWLYGWPERTSLVLPLLPFAILTRNRWDWLLLAWAAGLSLAHILYWAPGQMYGPRYLYEALPAYLLLSARGLVLLLGGVRRLLRRRDDLRWGVQGGLVAAVVALALVAGNAFLGKQMAAFSDWYTIDGERFAAVDGAVARPAVVFVEARDWTDFANFSWANAPSLAGPVVYAVDLGPERRRRLLGELPPVAGARRLYRYGELAGLVPLAGPDS